MRALCLCIALLGLSACERSTQADPKPVDESAAAAEGLKGGEDGKKPAKPAEKADDDVRIDKLPQIDLSKLDGDTKPIFFDLVNDLLSPCGEPVSVARCIVEKRKCKRCVPAARYVARLVDEGFIRVEINDLYRTRYDEETKVVVSAGDSPVRGATMAPLTIYEFSDFECPHCRSAAPYLKRAVEEYKGKVKLVFKHFPLSGHEHAFDAAIASVAAGKQGKFWEMHDILFLNQDKLSSRNIEKYAEKIGLDMSRFREDIKSPTIKAKVEADKALGRKIGVASTPTIIVGDRRFEFSPDMLSEYVREELDQ